MKRMIITLIFGLIVANVFGCCCHWGCKTHNEYNDHKECKVSDTKVKFFEHVVSYYEDSLDEEFLDEGTRMAIHSVLRIFYVESNPCHCPTLEFYSRAVASYRWYVIMYVEEHKSEWTEAEYLFIKNHLELY